MGAKDYFLALVKFSQSISQHLRQYGFSHLLLSKFPKFCELSPVCLCLVPTLLSETQYCLQILQRLPFAVPTILIAVLSVHNPALLEALTKKPSKLHGNKFTLLLLNVLTDLCHGPDPQSLILFSEICTWFVGFFSFFFGHIAELAWWLMPTRFSSPREYGWRVNTFPGVQETYLLFKLLNTLSLFHLPSLIMWREKLALKCPFPQLSR